ncbi:fimbrial protein [Klebsiella aerogenes]
MHKKIFFLILSSFIMHSTLAIAGGMGQGSGTVTFHGDIIDAPCSIAPESSDQTVEMGMISYSELVGPGGNGKSSPVPFSIELENCNINASYGNTVSVTFNGVQAGTDGELLALIGTADASTLSDDYRNAGIAISDGSGKVLPIGTPSSAQKLNTGDNTLQFTAWVQNDNPELNDYVNQDPCLYVGEFTSVANFSLSYQ